jgi:MYXO-CTERM domain-containing protein
VFVGRPTTTHLTLWIAVCLLAVLSPGGQGLALTSPQPGAAAKPSGLTLVAPFPCQTAYKVVAGYGGIYHKNVNEALKANDYHALDLVRDEAGGGHDKLLTALAAGTVTYAGWASGGWSTYGQIVILDLGATGGQTYQALYAHLHKVSVAKGQKVKPRDVLGTLGRSGNSSLTYWSTSHLHLAFYRGAKVGSGGPYGGVAAVPEPMDGVEDFVTGTKAKAGPCAPPPADAGPPKPDGSMTSDHGLADHGLAGPDSGGAHGDGGLPPPAGDLGGGGTPPSDGGCSCAAASGSDSVSTLGMLALALALLWRRRRR